MMQSDKTPTDGFDVVVAGAGNAGLMAALKLQKAGRKVLLVEQNNHPGGCATSYVRRRFELDPCQHEIAAVGSAAKPGIIRSLFEDMGVDIGWIQVKDCFRVVGRYSDGSPMDVTVPSGREALIDVLEREVPGCREKMEKFFRLLAEVNDGLTYFSGVDRYSILHALRNYPDLLVTGSYSCNAVFRAMDLPQKCIDILSSYWSYVGVDLDRAAFLPYAMMISCFMEDGAYISTATAHEISTALEDRFRQLGGKVWYNCRAESFLFKGDHLCGVMTSYGEVKCRYALANINQDIVYGKMVPKELVPSRIRKLASARKGKYGARMFTVHLCLDATPEELGIKDYSVFIVGTADPVKEYSDMMAGMDSNNFAIFVCYNVANPKASPEGTCICSLTTFCTPSDWEDLSQEEYGKFKTKCAEKLIGLLKENTGIDLKGHIEEISIATPWTFARYLGTPEGCAYGHEAGGWDDIITRNMEIDKDYPLKGLKTIGADGPRGDGFSSAYQCGEQMARLVLKELESEGAV